MHDFAFYFDTISFSKKHPCTLIFKGSCTNSNGREVIIKYTGTDINNESSIAIHSDILEQLHRELKNDFGYGPFDIKKARNKLKDKNYYYCNYKYDND